MILSQDGLCNLFSMTCGAGLGRRDLYFCVEGSWRQMKGILFAGRLLRSLDQQRVDRGMQFLGREDLAILKLMSGLLIQGFIQRRRRINEVAQVAQGIEECRGSRSVRVKMACLDRGNYLNCHID